MSKRLKPKRSEQAAYSLAKRGTKSLGRGDYDHAIRDLATAYDPVMKSKLPGQIKRALAEAHFRRGQRYLFENTDQALADLQKAAELQPADGLYAYHSGLAHHRFDQVEEAIRWYEEALHRDPTFDRAQMMLALARRERGDDLTDTSLWHSLSDEQRTLLQGKSTHHPLMQAIEYLIGEEWQPASLSLQTQLAAQPAAHLKPLMHYYLGVAAAGNDDLRAAYDYWHQAHQAGLDHPTLPENLTLVATLLAEQAITEQHYQQSFDFAETGLGVDPEHRRLQDIEAHARLGLGVEAARQGDWAGALKKWQGAENTSGELARLMAANSAIAYEKMERWEAAAEAWREYARRRPRKASSDGYLTDEQVARLWERVADLYQRAGVNDEAITTLQNALKYDPDRPDLNLALVQSYLHNDQIEAAENQLHRFLKKNPDHAEALALKAEIVEAYGYDWWHSLPSIREWKKVEATGDETFAPLARRRLADLYQQSFEEQMQWGDSDLALESANQALSYNPENHHLRARMVRALLVLDKPEKEVKALIDQIDLSDVEVVVELISGYYFADRPQEAATLIQYIDTSYPLTSDALVDIGDMVLEAERDALEMAEHYFDMALARTNDLQQTRVGISMAYRKAGYDDRTQEIWNKVLQEDPDYAPLHIVLGLAAFQEGDTREAKQHLRRAKKWASREDREDLLDMIARLREIIDNPFGQFMFDMLDGFE
jgi:tetratricopeptide (TPR) repeat protein